MFFANGFLIFYAIMCNNVIVNHPFEYNLSTLSEIEREENCNNVCFMVELIGVTLLLICIFRIL